MSIKGFVINRVSGLGFRVSGFEFRVYLPLVDDRWFGFRFISLWSMTVGSGSQRVKGGRGGIEFIQDFWYICL